MTRVHVVYFDDGEDRRAEDIDVYQPLGYTITAVTASREYLGNLSKRVEANQPGIYVLMNENTRYVGQASDAIKTRLNAHANNKTWWTHVAFYVKSNQEHFDPAQLNYMEGKLIEEFRNLGYEMDNKQRGISSYIYPLSEMIARQGLEEFRRTMTTFSPLDLFTPAPRRRKRRLLDSTHLLDPTQNPPTPGISDNSAPQPEEEKATTTSDALRVTTQTVGETEETYSPVASPRKTRKPRVDPQPSIKKLRDSENVELSSKKWKPLFHEYLRTLLQSPPHHEDLLADPLLKIISMQQYAELAEERKHLYERLTKEYMIYAPLTSQAVRDKITHCAMLRNRTVVLEEEVITNHTSHNSA